MTNNQLQIHPLFTVNLPVMRLDTFAHSAFSGASYHLDQIREIIQKPGMQTMPSDYRDNPSLDKELKRQLQVDANLFFWHLRAFFWELVASFDTMLQWANQRYELEIPEHDVRWTTIRQKANSSTRDPTEWRAKYIALSNAWNSAWYFEVRNYRNFAHRAFLFTENWYQQHEEQGKSEYRLSGIQLIPVRQGQPFVDIMEQLSNYLEEMRRLGAALFKQ